MSMCRCRSNERPCKLHSPTHRGSSRPVALPHGPRAGPNRVLSSRRCSSAAVTMRASVRACPRGDDGRRCRCRSCSSSRGPVRSSGRSRRTVALRPVRLDHRRVLGQTVAHSCELLGHVDGGAASCPTRAAARPSSRGRGRAGCRRLRQVDGMGRATRAVAVRSRQRRAGCCAQHAPACARRCRRSSDARTRARTVEREIVVVAHARDHESSAFRPPEVTRQPCDRSSNGPIFDKARQRDSTRPADAERRQRSSKRVRHRRSGGACSRFAAVAA